MLSLSNAVGFIVKRVIDYIQVQVPYLLPSNWIMQKLFRDRRNFLKDPVIEHVHG
jgi:hypothetical protein